MSFAGLPERLLKVCIRMGIAALAVTGAAWAQAPNLTGTWEMDTTKSQVADGRSMSMVIAAVANKIKIDATVRDKSGKEATAAFICAPDGKECDFDEGGHKSKMSMWFSGAALNVAKTDGPPGDKINEWKLETSGEGKVLTLTVTHIEPASADETLVFSKKPS